MACVLYREGKGTNEHGIECESTTCEIEDLEGLLDAGWLQDPPGYVAPEPVVAEEPEGLGEDLDGDDDADLIEQVASLKAQLDILQEMDEKSQAEIDRLADALTVAQTDSDAQAEEIARLNGIIAGLINEADDDQEDEVAVSGNSSPEEVRAAAKEAGIDGWDTKRIATLRAALEA